MICERSRAEKQIVKSREEGTIVPILAELPNLRHMLSHFYRLEKPSNFIYWKGSYNPAREGIDPLASKFTLPDDIPSIQAESFMIESLKIKTAVTFQGYSQPPSLFTHLGRIMIYTGMEPCSHNTLTVLDFQKNEVNSITGGSLGSEIKG